MLLCNKSLVWAGLPNGLRLFKDLCQPWQHSDGRRSHRVRDLWGVRVGQQQQPPAGRRNSRENTSTQACSKLFWCTDGEWHLLMVHCVTFCSFIVAVWNWKIVIYFWMSGCNGAHCNEWCSELVTQVILLRISHYFYWCLGKTFWFGLSDMHRSISM